MKRRISNARLNWCQCVGKQAMCQSVFSTAGLDLTGNDGSYGAFAMLESSD